jgi:hypothetical protein
MTSSENIRLFWSGVATSIMTNSRRDMGKFLAKQNIVLELTKRKLESNKKKQLKTLDSLKN